MQLFSSINIQLVDFKIEFGRLTIDKKVILADEISPDSCRLWDKSSSEKLDKDRFRKNLGGLIDTYKDCLLYTSPSPRDATLSRMPSSA